MKKIVLSFAVLGLILLTGCDNSSEATDEYSFDMYSGFYDCMGDSSPCEVTKDIEIGDKTVSLTHEIGEGEYFQKFSFSFDEKLVFEKEMIFAGNLYVGYYSFDDMFVVDYPDGLSYRMDFYNNSGDLVYSFPYPYSTMDYENGKFYFDADVNVFYSNFCGGSLLKEDYGYTNDTVIVRKYEVEYLGNQNFATPEAINETTFEDKMDLCD